MYERALIAIDASADSPDQALSRTAEFAKMSGATVWLLHVARTHVLSAEVTTESSLLDDDEDIDERERQVVQDAVNYLAAQGIQVHGELVSATEHDAADAILERAMEHRVDIIVLGYRHYRGSTVAEQIVRRRPRCSILLARPPVD